MGKGELDIAFADTGAAFELTKSTRPPAPPSAREMTLKTERALDRGELPRMRMFGVFGIGLAIGAASLTLLVDGDPFTTLLFRVGAGVICACNAWLIWLAGSEQRFRPWRVAIVWVGAAFGLLPALMFFGPFSGVVVAPMLGITIVALGRSLRIPIVVTAVVVVGHLSLGIPIAAGWIEDRGILHSATPGVSKLLLSEALLVLFFAAAFALGRWVRHTNVVAATALQRALQVIGDQDVVIAEVREDVAKIRGANQGRWTGHEFGGFRLGVVLGRGGMGEVYESQRKDGSTAAVKLLHSQSLENASLRERFQREVAIASKLESQHIVRVLAVSAPDEPVPFIAMERLIGRDLATILREQSRLSLHEVSLLLEQVAAGLEVARLANVVHRDLKPHNLFAQDSDGQRVWKILDFGVAKIGAHGTLTGGALVGTPAYMAPEQAAGDAVSHASDIYSLAAVAYRCLTGRLLFVGDDLAEVVYKIVHRAPVRPSAFCDIPVGVESVLGKALAKEPAERFESAVAMARAFSLARYGHLPAIDPGSELWA